MAENKKSNQADAYMESMKAYQKTYDFLLYLYPILSQFPKFEKFALQSQIKTAVFEMLKSVIRFRKTGTKSHIYNAVYQNPHTAFLRFGISGNEQTQIRSIE